MKLLIAKFAAVVFLLIGWASVWPGCNTPPLAPDAASHDAAGVQDSLGALTARDLHTADVSPLGDGQLPTDHQVKPVGDAMITKTPCASATYKTHCEGSRIAFCSAGFVSYNDCAGSVNPHCVAHSPTSAGCVASLDHQSCNAANLPACLPGPGTSSWSLSCTQEPNGLATYYTACYSPLACKPTNSGQGKNLGECASTQCSQDDRWCEGDTFKICNGGQLSNINCAASGQVCKKSLILAHQAGCIAATATPCDLKTYVNKCADTKNFAYCNPLLGYATVANCGQKNCCYGQDANHMNPSAPCCEP